MKKISWSAYTKPMILVLFMVILTVLRPASFLTVGNLSNVLWSVSVYGIMVCGTIFVFLIGGIDLSIGSLCGLCAVIAVRIIRSFDYTNTGVILGIMAALLTGIMAGLVHGVIITKFRVPAFLITFATQIIFLGLSMILKLPAARTVYGNRNEKNTAFSHSDLPYAFDCPDQLVYSWKNGFGPVCLCSGRQ